MKKLQTLLGIQDTRKRVESEEEEEEEEIEGENDDLENEE